MHVLGLDIGGAHTKAADNDGRACSLPFEIWKSPHRLTDVLSEALERFEPPDLLAVTMTAELADCFNTKAQGVDAILTSVELVARTRPVFVWQTGAEFVTPEVARTIPLMVAAANWHALATFVGRMAPEHSALLIDVGSTTTDIIPLHNGVPVPQGFTDCERLQAGELVYTGVRRTPVCALTQTVPLRNRSCRLAAELFATMLDVYLLLDQLPEDPDDLDTANGRPATRDAAYDRLARTLCCDRTELSLAEARDIARALAARQTEQVSAAIEQVLESLPAPCRHVLISGAGAFLARDCLLDNPLLANVPITDLQQCFTSDVAESACAYAVARLAQERVSG